MAQNVIRDPQTGAKFTKVKTLTGKSDVIDAPNQLMLSPNGKFLLFHCIVIPLDGSAPFDLVDMPALRGSWSPDGKKVAFYSGKAIWVVPVNPETARTSGPPTKLLDGKYQYDPAVSWSPDSDRIAFTRRDEKTTGDIWTLSIKDGTLHQVTDDIKPEAYPRWSPDGESIAYYCGNEIRLVAAGGGKARKIIDLGVLLSWTPDGEYLFCRDPRTRGFYLFRLADERVFTVDPPAGVGSFFSWSQDGKKMLFFRSSYEYSVTLRVVSSSGGPTFELGRELKLWPHIQFWTQDNNNIITKGVGDPTYWMIPLAGGEALPIKLDLSLDGKLHPSHFSLSPDRKSALLFRQRDDGKEDILMVPVSLEEARATGPATLVLEGWDRNRARTEYSWSPDGKELALIHGGHIWTASPGKGKPVQITKTSESPTYPVFSPAGGLIAYISEKEQGNLTLRVIPSSGGEPATVLDHCGYWRYAWSPDGRKLAADSKGVISVVSIPGGKPEPVFDLKREGLIDNASGLFWLPDGKRIGFISQRERDKPTRIYLIPVAGGKATELATDDDGYMNLLYPSPDGKWISYDSEGFVKTRPESSIWEVNLSDLLRRQ
jgi:Tol biopolymer transport system component